MSFLQPKLVPAMLDYETVEVACGANHVVAVTGRAILKLAQHTHFISLSLSS